MENNFVGEQIGHYRVDALLGRGGMGAVYRAYDLHLAREVALKVMHTHLADEEHFMQRFMQEAQTAARLDHPSIVNVYDFGQENDLFYMVMTYIDGGTFATYFRDMEQNNTFADLDEILFLLAQVADALGYAHTKGVLHRDVKPDNIMIKRLLRPERPGDLPMRAVVTDFGLAKLQGGGIHTATGVVLGSMHYISPEQCRGQTPGPGADIYALGVMLYHLATGKLPYNISSLSDAIYKHATELPAMPTELRPDLPPPLEVVINKAMAKNPSDRYQTAEELALILRRLRQTLTGGSPTVMDLEGGDAYKTPPLPAAGQATTLEPPVHRADSGRLKMVLQPNQMTVSPGRRMSAELNLVNSGGTAVSVRLGIEELPSSWVKMRHDAIHLPPGSQHSLSLSISPPLNSSATAGQHHFWIRAFSMTNQQIVHEVGGLLHIPHFERFAAELRPNQIEDGETAQILVRNDSNSPTSFQVGSDAPARNLRFESLNDQLQEVGPGQVGSMAIRVQAQERPLIGGKRQTPFNIQITGSSAQQQLQGQVTIKPRIPIVVLTLVLLLICLGGAAGAYLLFGRDVLNTADSEATEQALAAVQSQTPNPATATPMPIDPEMLTVEAQGTVLAITAEAAGDNDADGLANLVEEAIGTDPESADSDGDGLLDGEEVNQYNSDPLALDTDLDGLPDGEEINIYHTSVNNPDTDADGVNDGEEIASGGDPLSQPTSTPTMTSSPTTTPTVTTTPTPTPTATPRTTGAGTGGGLPLGFESFGVWGRGDQDNGTITQSGEQSHSGGSSAKISYDFATPENDFVVLLQFNDIAGEPSGLSVWVYGDGSGHYLNAWIIDSEGQTWQVPLGRVTHTGWAQMSGEIDTEQDWPWTHISGPDNELVDYPIRFRGFVLDDVNNAYVGQGEIYLDDLTAVE